MSEQIDKRQLQEGYQPRQAAEAGDKIDKGYQPQSSSETVQSTPPFRGITCEVAEERGVGNDQALKLSMAVQVHGPQICVLAENA
jgi:hypothetical protein